MPWRSSELYLFEFDPANWKVRVHTGLVLVIWNAIKLLYSLCSYIYHTYWELITIQLSLKRWSVFLALNTLETALCAVFSGMLVCTLQSHITPAAQSILLNRILQGFVLTTPQLYLFSTDTLLKLSRNAWLKSKLKSYFFCVFIRDWLCIHTAFLRWI